MVKKLKLKGLFPLIILGTFAPMIALAGEWRTETILGEERWQYKNDDGTDARNGWFWLDGNQNGTAECYYFDSTGWMVADAITPDGYTVNRDGAWTVQEAVQTKIASGNASAVGEKTMIPVTVQIGGREFSASLQDHASTQAFLAQLPMTVTMNEMNGNEMYYYLPLTLPTDTQSVGTVHAGDLMLFGSDCLVLFYEDFSTSYRYTRLGSISDTAELSEVLRGGSSQVTFRLNTQKKPVGKGS